MCLRFTRIVGTSSWVAGGNLLKNTLMLSSVQRRYLSEGSAGVLDSDSRAMDVGVGRPYIPTPVPAGAGEAFKGDTSEHPQGSPHPQTIKTDQAINQLEKAARLIEVASGDLETLNNGALASSADSIRDLYRLLLDHITDVKEQAGRYQKRNRPYEVDRSL